ncbi:sigma-70 family RNA polymerase sigma factor [Terribacillus saccharophilus]|nr:sigma-70 family RNA polymerase sigma factor [Terribacillus saccharophilus]
MTEQEKNDLYQTYKKRIYYMAYRYRFLNREIDEVVGWANIGFVKALNYFEQNPDVPFGSIVYGYMKDEIFSNMNRPSLKIKSLQSSIGNVKGDEGSSLETMIASEEMQNEIDIEGLFENALTSFADIERKISIDFFLNGLSPTELAKKHRVSRTWITKVQRHSRILLKKYLVDNDIIGETVDYLMATKQPKELENRDAREITPVKKRDYGKIKYILHNYPFLGHRDIAIILKLKTSSISVLLEFSTVGYLKCGEDCSVHDQVERYVQKWYPGQAAGTLEIVN